MVIPPSGLQATFRDLLDRAEAHVREHEVGEAQAFYLRNIQHPWRQAVDNPEDRIAPGMLLHAFEKFLTLAWSYTGGRPSLRHDLMPFVEVLAREKAGQAPDDPSPAA
jgi:hypothetical protein